MLRTGLSPVVIFSSSAGLPRCLLALILSTCAWFLSPQPFPGRTFGDGVTFVTTVATLLPAAVVSPSALTVAVFWMTVPSAAEPLTCTTRVNTWAPSAGVRLARVHDSPVAQFQPEGNERETKVVPEGTGSLSETFFYVMASTEFFTVTV